MQEKFNKNERIKRFTIGEMPLIRDTIEQLGFDCIFRNHFKSHGNQRMSTADLLLLLIYNVVCGRTPFYELQEWLSTIDSRVFGHTSPYCCSYLNDDIFARALDKLYEADRASLTTEISIQTIKQTQLDISRIHNDSTTVKAFGRYPGKTSSGFYLAHGNSKDHRPDLKQLLFTLTVSSDGGVPVHYKAYPGNRTDDTTHKETWKNVCSIVGRNDFLYVADSKVCTDTQLNFITKNGGRVVTIVPETWKETTTFKDNLRKSIKGKKRIWKRLVPGSDDKYETFSVFTENTYTEKRGYRIYWIYSTEKKKRDQSQREKKLQKFEYELAEMTAKLNQRNLKTYEQISTYIDNIVSKFKVKPFYHIDIREIKERHCKQEKRGRPGPNTKYNITEKKIYTVAWVRKTEIINQEKRTDGIFPLLCTDLKITAKEALKAYKYQPKLEKRFTQFKDIHNAAPLLFKKIERVEAVMFIFFLALIVQAVIERKIRKKMKQKEIPWLAVYPEGRIAYHPTTAKVFDRFNGVCKYQRKIGKKLIQEYRDSLTKTQKQILRILQIDEKNYWSDS